MRRLLVALATLPLLAGASACAQDIPPRPAGPVADFAEILPQEQEATLDGKLRAFFAANCIAIVVASVGSLEDQPIETYANRVVKGWEIGDSHAHQGLLVLVAPAERKVRIEISNSVNRVITNEMAQTIIDQDMIPSYRTGNLATGTILGVDAIVALLDAGRGSDGLDRESCHAAKEST
jgi:uncharacterized protein